MLDLIHLSNQAGLPLPYFIHEHELLVRIIFQRIWRWLPDVKRSCDVNLSKAGILFILGFSTD